MKCLTNNKNKKTIIILILCIFLLTIFSTIVYSAFSSTMNVDGTAFTRVDADVRITDFTINDTTNNSISMYETFSKNTISSEVSLKENSSITYNLEITNYGSTNVGIYDIIGIPEEISYSIEDYNLKEMICDNSGKCNSYAVRIYSLTVYTENLAYEGVLNFNFDFRPFHNITYKNITGSYPSSIINGDSIEIDLSADSPEYVYVDSESYVDYKYSNNILSLNNVTCDITIESISDAIYEFDYTGSYQTFSAPYDGIYKVELWGAQGGGEVSQGAYTSGNIKLDKGETFYIYVGQNPTSTLGGWNGGGKGYYNSTRAGGGSTDIRIVSGTWSSFDSLKSRIMVAAGGAGDSHGGSGAPGGDLKGTPGIPTTDTSYTGSYAYGYGANQTSGGAAGAFSWGGTGPTSGSFGQGGSGNSEYGGGGGGGYYGGGGSGVSTSSRGGGGSGSSFISGYHNCNAISSESTSSNIIHTGLSEHYSGYVFTNSTMISGANSMPTHDGTSTMIGNNGNGYAKITLLEIGNKYDIIYTNITGNYQSSINDGDDLIVNFGSNAPDKLTVLINRKHTSAYTYIDGILTVNNVNGDVEIAATQISYNYEYSGEGDLFAVPYTGIYKIELWGAQGGSNKAYGAYTSGKIELEKNEIFYVYVGENPNSETSGYNGGGSGYADVSTYASTAGGGSTDIRTISGAWNESSSLKSRIMVAAAGGGTSHGGTGGPAGGLNGYTGVPASTTSTSISYGYGASQIAGGAKGTFDWTGTGPTAGGFGYGGDGNTEYGGGGGSGYYGGGGSGVFSASYGGGGSGSSFISGHNGCIAITSSSSTTPRNDSSGNKCTTGTTDITCSYHYSDYKFTDTIMIDGKGYSWTTTKGTEVIGMPTHDGTSTMTGNTGNGYAKITLIDVNT